MPLSYDEIRSAVIEYVRTNASGQVPLHLGVFASHEARGYHVSDQDRETARHVFHELYLEKIIVSGASANSLGNGLMSWPFYVLTDYGRRVLSNPEYQPHDASGYLALLKHQIPTINPDVIRYLDESLQCFQRGTLLASAVMLGCAAEKAALLLIDAFGDAIVDAGKKQQYEKETAFWMISRKYEALWKRLEPLASGLPKDLGEDLHTILDRIFDLIRSTRNAAGHPTGKSVERETMRANFILFPSYCRRVYGLIDYFGKTPI
jgi:hypothetical protein